MIHDFAKSPRQYTLTPPVQVRPRRISLRMPKMRWLLVALVLSGIALWHSTTSKIEPETDYKPGKSESTEYQEAVVQQELEKAEAQAKLVERQRLVDELNAKVKSSGTTEPEFGFYDSLAGSSWTVPVQKGVYVTEEDRKRANQRYMLQAASVRDSAEAQRTVQRLRQLGLQAFYSHEETNGWYRINVGPFDNVSKMNKAEDILVSLRMMPLKRKI